MKPGLPSPRGLYHTYTLKMPLTIETDPSVIRSKGPGGHCPQTRAENTSMKQKHKPVKRSTRRERRREQDGRDQVKIKK